MYDLIAYLAALCTTVAFIPQALLVWKTKDTSSISFSMYSIFCSGVLFWLVYGWLTWQMPLIIANLLTFLFAFSIWWMKLKDLRRRS